MAWRQEHNEYAVGMFRWVILPNGQKKSHCKLILYRLYFAHGLLFSDSFRKITLGENLVPERFESCVFHVGFTCKRRRFRSDLIPLNAVLNAALT